MSGSFKDFYSRNNNPFGDEEDGTYRPWEMCQQGDAQYLKLVPARTSSAYVWRVPYLQPLTIRHDLATGQLCILCYSTATMIVLEGRGLDQLADLIAEKRIKTVHQFDPDIYPPAENEKPIITSMLIEERNSGSDQSARGD